MIDYERGYLSGKYVSLERCVSNFPNIYDQVIARGGVMKMLIGEAAHRVLGYATLTPGPAPARTHVAIVDVTTHDHYTVHMPKLIETLKEEAKCLGITTLQAYVTDQDETRKRVYSHFNFHPVAALPGQLNIDSLRIDITVLEAAVS